MVCKQGIFHPDAAGNKSSVFHKNTVKAFSVIDIFKEDFTESTYIIRSPQDTNHCSVLKNGHTKHYPDLSIHPAFQRITECSLS